MLTRFLCVILPPPDLAAWVVERRRELHRTIGSFSGRNLQPHITLFLADLAAQEEDRIVAGIAEGVRGQASFQLGYSGITHFPNKRTIYVDPVEKERIAPVRQSMVATLRKDLALQEAIRETDHPHLTIAAGLDRKKFGKAWTLLAPHEIQATGRVGELVLLKRLLRSGERYVPVRAFPLVDR